MVTMQLPHEELLAPKAMAGAVQELDRTAVVASLDGRAADIEDLRSHTELRFLWASRLSAQGAAVVGSLSTLSRLVVHDYRASDLRPLAGLGRLETLAVVGSPRLRSLEGAEKLHSLRELLLVDNSNYTSLAPLQHLEGLTRLCLEGGFSKVLRIETLSPLSGLGGLRALRLASIQVVEGGLRPLHQLSALRDVFVAATFGEAELRALATALPQARGQFLDQWRSDT